MIVIGWTSFLGISCGYRFSGAQKAPFDLHRINVAVFENLTSEPGLEVLFANELISEMTRDGRMVLAAAGNADGLFSGVIKFSDVETIARTDGYAATEKMVSIHVDVILKNRMGSVLWSGKDIVDSETYLVDQDKLGTEYNRKTAISKISRQIAQNIFQRLSWDF